MKSGTQTSESLSPADIQLFENKDAFSNIYRTSMINQTDNMKKMLSKSETSLSKFKDKEKQKQKKKVLN